MPTPSAQHIHHCQLLYTSDAQQAHVARLCQLASAHCPSLQLSTEQSMVKLTQKRREQISMATAQPILLLDDKNKLSWLSAGLSVAPEWDKLQRRVVSAGRKSELLLQAAKISAGSRVLDATAGFGHDSLILASTGAQVTMLEQQPVMALLLLAEQQRMSVQPNWQKLMARLQIINTDAISYFEQATQASSADFDVVYLDPMFPEDSYQDRKTGKGAKVGKHMQALHHLALPPTPSEELALLSQARGLLSKPEHTDTQDSASASAYGRVVVKRPQHAPYLADQAPDERWHNDAVRFDGYFNAVS